MRVIRMRGPTLTAMTFSLAAARSRRASGVIYCMQAGETQPKASTRRNTFAFEYARLKNSSQALEFNAQMRGETDLEPWWTPASA